MRGWWLVVVALLPAAGWAEEPLLSEIPSAEIARLIGSSPLGLSLDDPNQLLFPALDVPVRVSDLPAVDLGVDLDYGRRLLEAPPQLEIVRPESLVGL